jgi:hypothetical protein
VVRRRMSRLHNQEVHRWEPCRLDVPSPHRGLIEQGCCSGVPRFEPARFAAWAVDVIDRAAMRSWGT